MVADSIGAGRIRSAAASSSTVRPRRDQVAGRERDLRQCRQEPHAADVVGRLGDGAVDHGPSRRTPPAGEQQQREAGLRPAAPLAGLAVGGLGRRVLAAQAVSSACT